MKNLMSRLLVLALVLGSGMSAIAQDTVRRLTQEEAKKAATTKVQPEYPAMARQLKMEGAVQVQANINERGAVESVKILNGNILLANAAAEALKKWKFTPLTVDGKSTAAVASLSFTFKL